MLDTRRVEPVVPLKNPSGVLGRWRKISGP